MEHQIPIERTLFLLFIFIPHGCSPYLLLFFSIALFQSSAFYVKPHRKKNKEVGDKSFIIHYQKIVTIFSIF